MSIILQALAKNQDRLIPNNPTRIQPDASRAATRPRAAKRHPLPDVSPIWDDTHSRAAQAVAPEAMVTLAPRGLSEIKISWVLIVVAMGCMFGMLAAFYPPTRVEARTAVAAVEPLSAAQPDATAPAQDIAEPADLQLASAVAADPVDFSSTISDQPALQDSVLPAPAADAASSVVRVVFRKEGGQTEPDGTYRQEYALPVASPVAEQTIDRDQPLAIPGLVPVNPSAGTVPEIAYEDDTLYEAAPIPTITRDVSESAQPKFKSKSSRASAPKAEAKPEPAAMRVEGIFWDRTRPMALINGDIVEIGSRVRDGQVVDIQPSSVTIDIKGVKTVMSP